MLREFIDRRFNSKTYNKVVIIDNRNEWIVQSKIVKNACFKNRRIEGSVFSFGQYWHANFSNSKLLKVLFSSTDLRWSNLNKIRASECVFDFAKLNDVNLSGSNLVNCSFKHTDLEGCDLRGSNFLQTNIHLAKLRRATFDKFTKLPFPDEVAFRLGMIRV